MSPKQVILTENAPKPLPGVYSQAIVANGTVYCSGAIGMDPATGKIVEGDIQARTVQASPLSPFLKLVADRKVDYLAPMHQKPHRSPQSCRNLDRQRRQSQRLHRGYEGFRGDE